MAQAKDGEHISLVRFDGDNGEYSLLLGNAKTVDGPYTKGTYMWVEVENLDRLEDKLVQGPYIHHCVGVHQNVVPVLYEACKYIGVTPDLYDPIEEKVKAIIVDKLSVEETEVTNEASFTNDLGADSLDTVELIMEFEKEFGISIPDDQAEKIGTVGDAVSYIEEHAK